MNSVGQNVQTLHHITRQDWLTTSSGEPRGYIQPKTLKELWFHTGTMCNLRCPFCLEGSKPGDNRLNKITLNDVKPFMDQAVGSGVEKFSFTGGEPFVIADMVKILHYALAYRPCLVLTNATKPLKKRLKEIEPLKDKLNPLHFRVSVDYPEAKKHDAGRGRGNFDLAWRMVKELSDRGFGISIARQREKGENAIMVEQEYFKYFEAAGLPLDTRIVSFPDFFTPGCSAPVPEITEHGMTYYHSEKSRDQFMCGFSKMVVKENNQMRVYACALVDDDLDYDFGAALEDAMSIRVMLKHHRCYSCFAQGAVLQRIVKEFSTLDHFGGTAHVTKTEDLNF